MHVANFQALRGLDTDIRSALLQQIRDLWTHGSTAIEGNTLTLGETKFVIEVRERKRYIDTLATYQIAVGQLGSESSPMPDPAHETEFLSFCHASYGATRALIEAARERQAARNRHDARSRR